VKKLLVSNSVDPVLWNNNVIRLGGCCFHTYEWSLFSATNNNATPLYFQYNDAADSPVSVGFGLLKQKRIAGVPFFKTLSFGSLPAHNKTDALNSIIGEIISYCRSENMASLELNSFGTPIEIEVLRESEFAVTRRWEFILDIGKNEEDLWEELHSKKRNLIRKALKEGVRVEKEFDIDAIMEFRNLAFKTWQRKKSQGIAFPEPAHEDYYRLLKKKVIDPGLGKLYLAYEGDEIIAGAFFAGYNGSAYYMLSSSSDQGLKRAAPDLILWTCITDYQKEGYRLFNLGGISEGELNDGSLEASGLYHFKKRFCAAVHPCLKGRLVLRPSYHNFLNFFQRAKSLVVSKSAKNN
jgi:lipid II:glycine glycyltransferase (peptidoglycan interpeptide bridge formation enzyme)